MKSTAAIAAIFGGLALLVGCGGSDDGGLPTGDISRAEYIEQADQICAESDQKLQRAAGKYFDTLDLGPGDEPSEKQIAEFTEATLIGNVDAQLDELGELEAPADDAEQIAEVYDTAREELDAIEQDPASAASGSAFAKANRMAQDFGFEICGAG